MITGPKYKRARRLGAHIYDKTMGQKFALSLARRGKPKDPKHPRQKTDYGNQMLEKQKVRFTYGISERQFVKYVRESMAQKAVKPTEEIFRRLESRLDNAVYRLGFANSRQFSRQLVSHRHIQVNGKNVTIPSYELSKGDVITIRPGSLKKPLFATLDEKLKTITAPAWLGFDMKKKEAVVAGSPKMEKELLQFNLASVVEFYSR